MNTASSGSSSTSRLCYGKVCLCLTSALGRPLVSVSDRAGAKRSGARDPGAHLLAFVALQLGSIGGLGNRERLPAHTWRGLRLTAVSSSQVGRRALRMGADAGE